MKTQLILSIGLMLAALPLLSQEELAEAKPKALIPEVQAGVLIGGQVFNERFVYASGFKGQTSISKALGPRVQAGLGLGVIALADETFVPLFIDLRGQFRPGEDRAYLGASMGNSLLANSDLDRSESLDMEGGLYFKAYYGFQFPFGNSNRMLLSFGYLHQSGRIEFEDSSVPDSDERFSYDFISINAGLRF